MIYCKEFATQSALYAIRTELKMLCDECDSLDPTDCVQIGTLNLSPAMYLLAVSVSKLLKFFPDCVVPVSTAAMKDLAKDPKYAVRLADQVIPKVSELLDHMDNDEINWDIVRDIEAEYTEHSAEELLRSEKTAKLCGSMAVWEELVKQYYTEIDAVKTTRFWPMTNDELCMLLYQLVTNLGFDTDELIPDMKTEE